MENKQVVDLTLEDNQERLDLNFRHGDEKGKIPMDGFTETRKRKRIQSELEDDSTTRSSEDRLALLEHKLDDQEKLINRCLDEIVSLINRLFIFATSCFCNIGAGSVDCLNNIRDTLQQISRSLSPRTGSELNRFTRSPSSTSKQPNVPSSSKSPNAHSSSKQPRE